jgi:hypothetical protein
MRICQRRGAERFHQIFERSVQACIAARIPIGEVVHLDASLIRAHVSWDTPADRHAEAVGEANSDGDEHSGEYANLNSYHSRDGTGCLSPIDFRKRTA